MDRRRPGGVVLVFGLVGTLVVGLTSLRLGQLSQSSAAGTNGDRPASAQTSPESTATCSEPADDGGARWAARYSLIETLSPPLVRFSAVGGPGPGVLGSHTSRPWMLTWIPSGSDQPVTVAATAAALSGRVVQDAGASLVAPDGACTRFIPSPAPAAQHTVAVIGDSVFANAADAVGIAGLDLSSVSQWQIVARSGFGWGASPTAWPLGATHGTWAIGLARGLISDHVGALVIELGANDALRAAFAEATNNSTLLGAIRLGVSETVTQVLQEATARLSCVVLVTAPAHPRGLFGSGTLYSAQALAINEILRDTAARAGPGVRVADWAARSASHHGPSVDGGWFLPDDDVHLNPAGSRALVRLVRSELDTCA
jgi:lysophospholipase L1-like esterase